MWLKSMMVKSSDMFLPNCKYIIDSLFREEDEENQGVIHGHITSISVLRGYRRLGLASKLMQHSCILFCFNLFSENDARVS